jgi:hypothetical protein
LYALPKFPATQFFVYELQKAVRFLPRGDAQAPPPNELACGQCVAVSLLLTATPK